MHPLSEILCKIYRALHAKGEVSFELSQRNIDAIDSVVKTVESHYFGFARFKTETEKAAAYFCFIIKDHPVTDGNKRLAVLTLQVYVDALELRLQLPSGITLDELAVAIEKEKALEMDTLLRVAHTILFQGDLVDKV